MAWKLIGTKTQLANKGIVNEFVNMEPAPYDRPLSERRMMVYERILKSGEFRPVTWASVACAETNCTYRVNGKHTSLMLSKMNPLPDLHVTIERYKCDTLQDVANLYNTFDSKMMSRTTGDINLAFAAAISELRDIPHRLIHLTVTAAAFHKWGEKAKEIPPAEKAEELMDAYPFAVWLTKFFPSGIRGNRSNAHLSRSPVITAMMATYNKAPHKAEEFWRLVLEESSPDKDDPSRVLARYLVRVALSGGATRGQSQGRKLVDTREMYVKCLHAWNAWRKGETTALNYHAKSDIPSVSK